MPGVAKTRVDRVTHDGVPDGAITALGRRPLEGAGELTRNRQEIRDSTQALLVTKAQLLVQIIAVAKWSVLSEECIKRVERMLIWRAPVRGPCWLSTLLVQAFLHRPFSVAG